MTEIKQTLINRLEAVNIPDYYCMCHITHDDLDTVISILKERQAQTNAQQTHGEICPYYEKEMVKTIEYIPMDICRCSGKLSPC